MSQPQPANQPAKPPQPGNTMATPPALQTPAEPASLENLNPAQALELFISDPFAFVQQIVNDAAKTHLADLKEEAELKSALNAYRKKSPEFQRFEPFILQEVVTLLRDDPDGGTASWEQLLEKAMTIFRQKFEATLQAQMGQAQMGEKTEQADDSNSQPPYMESAANRMPSAEPPSYTRKQIAKMSLPEFLKNEAAINDAIQNNRIR